MLRLETIEDILGQKDYGEDIYRELYQMCPQAYETPITSWEELCGRFPVPIVSESPTIVKDILFENEFFGNEDMQVSCFKNLRYCPPFLHKLEFIKIVYILRGTSLFYLNGRSYQMKEGNFCIVSPGVEQAMFTNDMESIAVNMLMRASTFTQAFSAVLMEQGILSDFFWKMAYTKYCNRVLFFASAPDIKLKTAVLRLFAENQLEEKPSSIICESYIGIFLGEGIRRHLQDMVSLEGMNENVYQIPAILQDIQENVRSVTLEKLAAKWRMKESEIHFELKMETGHSFSYLLSDLRLQKAADLLEKTGASIESIMEEVGWNDSVTFYRNFKRRYGKTPQMYRKQMRG